MSAGPGRNDPCPCGSGRKYKHCHLGSDATARRAEASVAGFGRLGGELTREIFEFAANRFGEPWEEAFCEPFFDPGEVAELVIPYAVYHVPIDGRTPAEHFLAARGARIPADARSYLEAEADSWLSIHEVLETRPGEGLALRDRLTGSVREVVERMGSKSLVAKDTVLGRLVSFRGVYRINGLHPHALSPTRAAEVERLARGHLRRKRDVPPERLRQPKAMRYLIRRFEELAFGFGDAAPELRNQDGDPILLTTDHFAVAAGAEGPDGALARRLASMPGMLTPEPDDPDGGFALLGDDSVLLGQLFLSGPRLRVETNSLERADALRRRLESACQGLVTHRGRVHADPLSDAREEPEPPPTPSPEAQQVVRELKARHYAEWPDIPLPALSGQTPREAVHTREGRARVTLLLDELENLEARRDPAERFDVGSLRRELGLG